MNSLLSLGCVHHCSVTRIDRSWNAQQAEKALDKARKESLVRVIVTRTVKEIPEGELNREAKDWQRQAIAARQNKLIA